MLDANIKTQLKAYLEKLQTPIEIVASFDDNNRLMPKGARVAGVRWQRAVPEDGRRRVRRLADGSRGTGRAEEAGSRRW